MAQVDLGAPRHVGPLLGPRPDRAQHRAAHAAAAGQGRGRAGDGHRPRDGPARRRGRGRRRSAAARRRHVDPSHRPRGLQPVPRRARSCASCSPASTTSRSAPWSSPRPCTRSSATAAAASPTPSRRASSGLPTRSTWPQGRSRVPVEAGRVGIHALSAAAIDEVAIEAGDDRPVRIEIKMNNSAGHLPGRRPAGDEAARHPAREPRRGRRDDRGRDREAAADASSGCRGAEAAIGGAPHDFQRRRSARAGARGHQANSRISSALAPSASQSVLGVAVRAGSATRPPSGSSSAERGADRPRPRRRGRGPPRAGTRRRSRCGGSRRGGSSSSPRRTREEPLTLQVVGDEPKRGQAEGALEDQVVDGHEADLRRQVVRRDRPAPRAPRPGPRRRAVETPERPARGRARRGRRSIAGASITSSRKRA